MKVCLSKRAARAAGRIDARWREHADDPGISAAEFLATLSGSSRLCRLRGERRIRKARRGPREEGRSTWPTKAIAIVMKDTRSSHGAPNVVEEIGRWLQAKGGRTLRVIRQEGTQINPNAVGLIWLSF